MRGAVAPSMARVLMPDEFAIRRAYKAIGMKGKRDTFSTQFHKRLYELQPKLVESLSPNQMQQKKRLLLLVEAIIDKIGDDGSGPQNRPPAEARDTKLSFSDLRMQHITLAFVDALEFSTNQSLSPNAHEWFEHHVRSVLGDSI